MSKSIQFEAENAPCLSTSTAPEVNTVSAAHTPTPWYLEHNGQGRINIAADHGQIIARFTNLVDARYIVRAVNAHESLLDNLKAAINLLEDDSRSERRRQACLTAFHAVLAESEAN